MLIGWVYSQIWFGLRVANFGFGKPFKLTSFPFNEILFLFFFCKKKFKYFINWLVRTWKFRNKLYVTIMQWHKKIIWINLPQIIFKDNKKIEIIYFNSKIEIIFFIWGNNRHHQSWKKFLNQGNIPLGMVSPKVWKQSPEEFIYYYQSMNKKYNKRIFFFFPLRTIFQMTNCALERLICKAR